MSGFKNVMQGGWHPKGKEGKKESWRGDFKGINQVAGWMGKGKDPSDDASEHVSQPLSSLKDPSSFGPPPKHIHYHGAAALPNETTPDRRGIGAPLSQNQIAEQNAHRQQAVQEEEEAAQNPPAPPIPYRVNTTGLSTNNLPPPPVRRLDSPNSGSSASASAPAPASAKPRPQLPPRVPPRNATPETHSPSPPPAYNATPPPALHGYVNQQATSCLASAGVSVPALGIGEANASSPASSGAQGANVNELQSRFSQMRTNSGSASPQSPARTPIPSANREDALPPPLTFRERHADKIDMGKEKWGGVTSRFNTFVEDRKFSANANKRIPRPPGPNSPSSSSTVINARPSAVAENPTQSTGNSTLEAQAQRKKAPPPPPPKRADIRAAPVNASPTSSASYTPPPVPLNTKPR
ncbi:hypothetical protein PEBR_21450 [Penicillium brasilianum]|uniref:Uncharacterized protein n=1 Tax=Penicillium brasilianum TaxID=104259 RepID=A0A1S9RLQ9_PENBI|nr:hypothetical protein PEBR_21450 [Penicillium brasilianum]